MLNPNTDEIKLIKSIKSNRLVGNISGNKILSTIERIY